MTRITIEKIPEVKSEEQKRHLVRYVNYINSRPERELKQKGFHTHHIYPKSIARKNEIPDFDGDWNLIELTYREHFIAHLILSYVYPGKMSQAFHRMTHDKNNYQTSLTSKQYASLVKNLKHTLKTKEKMSKTRTGKKHTKDWNINIGRLQKGRVKSKEENEKHSKAMLGKKATKKQKKREVKIQLEIKIIFMVKNIVNFL